MKVCEVIKQIEADGWVFAHYRGRSSHRVYKKAGSQTEIAISGIGSDEMPPGQLQSVRIIGVHTRLI